MPGFTEPMPWQINRDSDERDGALFRLWIRLAATNPSRIAVALAKCTTEADYRAALMSVAKELRINLP